MPDDPYKFFRVEAREIHDGLARGIAQLGAGPASADLVARILRLAHTLKGAARVVKQVRIAEAAHAIEDVLTPLRAAGAALAEEGKDELHQLLENIAREIDALDGLPTTLSESRAQPSAAKPAVKAEPTVRIELGDLDTMVESVAEVGTQVSFLRQQVARVEHVRRLAEVLGGALGRRSNRSTNGDRTVSAASRAGALADELRSTLSQFAPALENTLDHVERAVVELRERAGRLRLLPVSSLFAALEHTARDVAQALAKQVEFTALGGENRIDGYALGLLRDALLQVVNNAVAHGIENPHSRIAAGKAPAGQLRLEVTRRDNRILFTCRDDGRGIDPDTVRRAAIARGVISPAEAAALSPDETIRLVLRAGVTTTGSVTQVAGRGVGLDLLREIVARLSGTLEIRSERGRGTVVELGVPVSLSSLHALVVEAEGARASIPLEAVVRTGRVTETELAHFAGVDSIVIDEKAVPFVRLAGILEKRADLHRKRRAWSFVVIQSGAAWAALGVDRLLGVATIVARPLPAAVESIPAIAGVSFDEHGVPCPLLEPAALAATAARSTNVEPEAAAPARPPVLIVDDSLTTRMLERSILESAGYEVELATSGEQALDLARDHPPSLFVVDVEMPGMNGFDLVSRVRADTILSDIPAIIVSSRDDVEDRRRGASAGAQGYIIKGEFDERYLLDTIRGLIG
jgi:two-component system chemotaxis sensor kinase CheA